ncbi:MAG TPA: hypothetical protein VGA77_06605 [Propylenella sp.]
MWVRFIATHKVPVRGVTQVCEADSLVEVHDDEGANLIKRGFAKRAQAPKPEPAVKAEPKPKPEPKPYVSPQPEPGPFEEPNPKVTTTRAGVTRKVRY